MAGTDAQTPYVCHLCRRPVPIDDAEVPTPSGICICVGCWRRAVVDGAKRVEKRIQREIDEESGG